MSNASKGEFRYEDALTEWRTIIRSQSHQPDDASTMARVYGKSIGWVLGVRAVALAREVEFAHRRALAEDARRSADDRK